MTSLEETFFDLSSFARPEVELEGASLLETIEAAKPDVLIGLSATKGIFTPEILSRMNELCSLPPIIFPLSNPTSR